MSCTLTSSSSAAPAASGPATTPSRPSQAASTPDWLTSPSIHWVTTPSWSPTPVTSATSKWPSAGAARSGSGPALRGSSASTRALQRNGRLPGNPLDTLAHRRQETGGGCYIRRYGRRSCCHASFVCRARTGCSARGVRVVQGAASAARARTDRPPVRPGGRLPSSVLAPVAVGAGRWVDDSPMRLVDKILVHQVHPAKVGADVTASSRETPSWRPMAR
jgi:hypothetical protein